MSENSEPLARYLVCAAVCSATYLARSEYTSMKEGASLPALALRGRLWTNTDCAPVGSVRNPPRPALAMAALSGRYNCAGGAPLTSLPALITADRAALEVSAARSCVGTGHTHWRTMNA